MDIHFKCTQCGRCCRDTKIPLTVTEAVKWLERGHDVQLLCEAHPWTTALDGEARALHFKRRSFAITSGSMAARVVVMLVANVVGPCPNLRENNLCGIYEERPLVCRIYPSEINPFIVLQPANKACPPEAWTQQQPLLQRGADSTDGAVRQDIESSRAADVRDAELKRRMCFALDVRHAALVHEAMLVYSPTVKGLLSALAIALATEAGSESATPWCFVSDLPETLATLTNHGGIAIHSRDAKAESFQLLGLKREPIFGLNAH